MQQSLVITNSPKCVWNKGMKIDWIKGEEVICPECGNKFSKQYALQKCCSIKCSKIFRSKYHKQYISKPEYNKIIRKKYDKKYYASDKYKIIIQPLRKEYQKEYKKSPKYIEKKIAYDRREDVKMKKKEYAKLHPQSKTSKKAYRQSKEGREILKMHCRNRRAILKNVIHKFTRKEWEQKVNLTNGICPGCVTFVGIDKLALDHIYPLSLANRDFQNTGIKRVYTILDIQPYCQSCNSIKFNKIIELEGGQNE